MILAAVLIVMAGAVGIGSLAGYANGGEFGTYTLLTIVAIGLCVCGLVALP